MLVLPWLIFAFLGLSNRVGSCPNNKERLSMPPAVSTDGSITPVGGTTKPATNRAMVTIMSIIRNFFMVTCV